MHRFLTEDLVALTKKRDELSTQLRARGQEMGEANAQSSETWHDNAPLDVAQREFERIQRQLEDMEKVIRTAKIVTVDEKAASVVTIGSEVTFLDQDGNERTVKIGSYLPAEGAGSISYEAPVAKILMGAEVGDVAEGKIVDKDVELEVLKITRWV